ncbi:hypothetical protein I317_00131 [Kwoniella heveanensis CBS 569]|nr:hypothetical protein I317_00131 [Kwoniella heveanensis CBS 569]
MAFNSSVIANIHTPVSDPPRSPSVNSRVAESSVSRSSPVGGPNKQTEAGPSKHKDTDADVTLKWFKKYNTRKLAYNHGHPYVCRSITFGSPYDKEAQRFEDVKFWPFVGPLEPPGLLAGVQSWEYCKNMVAIATKNKVCTTTAGENDQ